MGSGMILFRFEGGFTVRIFTECRSGVTLSQLKGVGTRVSYRDIKKQAILDIWGFATPMG